MVFLIWYEEDGDDRHADEASNQTVHGRLLNLQQRKCHRYSSLDESNPLDWETGEIRIRIQIPGTLCTLLFTEVDYCSPPPCFFVSFIWVESLD